MSDEQSRDNHRASDWSMHMYTHSHALGSPKKKPISYQFQIIEVYVEIIKRSATQL